MSDEGNATVSKVFRVEDYEYEVRFSKLKMADPIWRSRIYFCEFWIFFLVIDLKALTRGFLQLVMIILKSEFKNKK